MQSWSLCRHSANVILFPLHTEAQMGLWCLEDKASEGDHANHQLVGLRA